MTHHLKILFLLLFSKNAFTQILPEQRIFQPFIKVGVINQVVMLDIDDNRYVSGTPGLGVGIEYEYVGLWLLDLGLKFSNMSYKPNSNTEEDLYLTSLEQSVRYLYRIYQPFYLTIGYSIGFLFISEEFELPPEKHPVYSPKFIGGANIGLMIDATEDLRFEIEVSRWRDTDGQKLGAYALNLHASYRLGQTSR